jgi:hypothetical protein
LALGNEPLRFRNVSEDVLASKKPPGGLEDACLRFPKRGVEPPGGFPGRIQVLEAAELPQRLGQRLHRGAKPVVTEIQVLEAAELRERLGQRLHPRGARIVVPEIQVLEAAELRERLGHASIPASLAIFEEQ